MAKNKDEASKEVEKTKKVSKNNKKWYEGKTMSAIIGLGMLFSVASIVYSTTMIILGTEGFFPLIWLIPQAGLALVILVKQFIK